MKVYEDGRSERDDQGRQHPNEKSLSLDGLARTIASVKSRLSKYGNIAFSAVLLLAATTSLSVRAQNGEDNSTPILVEEFSLVGDCDFGGRLDLFLAELSQKPDFLGYVINYKGIDELPQERDSYARETAIANHIAFRNFDGSRITILRGGYRAEITTELWIAAPGVSPPQPSKTVPAPVIPERSTFLFARNYLAAYGDISSLDDYVLPTVKAREAAELEEMKQEADAEQVAETTENSETSPASGDVPAESSDDAEPYVDVRTVEEKEAEKFLWAEVGVAKFIAERKASTGVIFFYADDERYDIEKMRQLLESGRDRLAQNAKIKRGRLKIEFGGYRETAEVEFWFVPSRGKAPRPKPEERPMPEPEDTDAAADPPN